MQKQVEWGEILMHGVQSTGNMDRPREFLEGNRTFRHSQKRS